MISCIFTHITSFFTFCFRLATFIQSLGKQKANSNNINDISNNSDDYDRSITPSAVTLNGDFLSPSALSSIDNGRGHVAALRAAGVTHVSLGKLFSNGFTYMNMILHFLVY